MTGFAELACAAPRRANCAAIDTIKVAYLAMIDRIVSGIDRIEKMKEVGEVVEMKINWNVRN